MNKFERYPNDRFANDVCEAMSLLRNTSAELPSWLTAHLDTCERCGAEKVWMHKPFDSEVWSVGQMFSGQGWHGCTVCSKGPM